MVSTFECQRSLSSTAARYGHWVTYAEYPTLAQAVDRLDTTKVAIPQASLRVVEVRAGQYTAVVWR